MVVFAVNVALVAPAGTVTVEGTLAAALLLDLRATCRCGPAQRHCAGRGSQTAHHARRTF